ncbi:MXAN_2562 family outer membrane beta-barrel protein [Geomonas sp.]|uniref:MXAN_2562 family outer membrane beta-barrel protein n=1 Tax=Geomonas sp. TaxID=2651584 RepID=UPI002B47C5D3|nr:MXAN_2562 family outer membrane beta-barrel protein [Geomonas sp.]HJV35082.1 MXAN_2562 family outer membrane beta-barrel protein [Geomonas sp.]
MRKLLLAVLLTLIPALALAEQRPERPHWSLELKGGVLFPDVDRWSTFYGSSYTPEFGGSLAYKVTRQVEVGIEGSYSYATGKGGQLQHGTTAGEVTFDRAPLSVFVLARGVMDEDQWLVPYAGGGYTRLFYRSDVTGQGTTKGSVNGFNARAGVEFLMDRLERDAAESLYRDFGLQHTYFFVEGRFIRAMGDTTGGSVNLGGTSCLGGFLFEF